MQPYNEPQTGTPPGYTVPHNISATPPSYVGNKTDNTATLAMIAGVGLVLSSCTGIGGCLIPLFALVGGVIALRSADQAINPSRTRTYSWIAIAAGGIVLLLILGVVLLYGSLFAAAFSQGFQTAP
jgi:hypothetical protein